MVKPSKASTDAAFVKQPIIKRMTKKVGKTVLISWVTILSCVVIHQVLYSPSSPTPNLSPRSSTNEHAARSDEAANTRKVVSVADSPGNNDESLLPFMSWEEFSKLSKELVGDEVSEGDRYPATGCPKECGCAEKRVDCPRKYSIDTVIKSAEARLSPESQQALLKELQDRHEQAKLACDDKQTTDENAKKKTTSTGGYCLRSAGDGRQITLPSGLTIEMPQYSGAAERIVLELVAFMKETDGATNTGKPSRPQSLLEFGAGVGQYPAEVVPRLPKDCNYWPYDGAGNVERYTESYVKFIDLATPFNLERKADWVISFEVGEHIPPKFEGALIRNLHRHNCRGVILSWAVLGQNGLNHINNHSNEYVTSIFQELGYTRDESWETRFRNPDGNKGWFRHSIMVFRRNTAVC